MGLELVDNILKTLRQGQEKRAETTRLQLEKDRQDQEWSANQDRLKIEQDRLKQDKNHQDQLFKLAQQAANVSHLAATTDLANRAARGEIIPGDTKTPGDQTFSQGQQQVPTTGSDGLPQLSSQPTINQNTLNYNHSVDMGPGSEPLKFNAPSPEQTVTDQAKRQEILDAPKVAAKIKEELELQKSRNQQAEENKRADFQRLIVQKGFDDARNAETLRSQEKQNTERVQAENSRAALQRANELTIHKLPFEYFTNNPNITGEDKVKMLQPYMDAIDNGDMSATDLKKDFFAKGMGGADAAVLGIAMKNGSVPLSDIAIKTKQALQPIVGVIQNMDKLIQSLPQTGGTGLGSKVAAAGKGLASHVLPGATDIDSLYKELESQIATVAKGVSGDAGQRLQKAMLTSAHGGYMPDRNVPTSVNTAVRNNFVKEVNQLVDTSLGALPAAQKARIKSKMGLSAIPLMKSDGSYVGQDQQQQAPKELIWTPQGLQPKAN